jgi:hypothetical protein
LVAARSETVRPSAAATEVSDSPAATVCTNDADATDGAASAAVSRSGPVRNIAMPGIPASP